MTETALAVQENGKQQQTSLSLDIRQVEAQIQQFVPVLREIVTNGKKLTDEQIRGRAMFAAINGLDPVTEVHTITDNNGKTLSHTMAIDGYRRKCQEQVGYGNEITLDFVEMDPATLKKFGNVLVGYECRLKDGASYTQWQKRLREVGNALREAMGGAVSFQDLMSVVGQPPVYVGVGLFYQSELSEWKDKNFNPIERCKKRAELNARRKRFPTNADISEGDTAPQIVNDGSVEIIDETPAAKPATRTEVPNSVDAIMGQLYGEPVQAPQTQPTMQETALDLGGKITYSEPDEPPAEDSPFDEPPAPVAPPKQRMSYEMAATVKNRDGVPYTDIPSDKLTHMSRTIAKAIKENGLDPEAKSEHLFKLDAIAVILQSRSAQ